MVVLEEFKLAELKDIFNYIRNKYKILEKYKIYKLNKYDIIVIMRNSDYFFEESGDYLLFKYKKSKIKFYPKPSKRFYKGNKKQGLMFYNIPVVLKFD